MNLRDNVLQVLLEIVDDQRLSIAGNLWDNESTMDAIRIGQLTSYTLQLFENCWDPQYILEVIHLHTPMEEYPPVFWF